MWRWLSEQADALNVLANVGMLVVWLSYLQLFLAGYRRERRAKILVNRGGGTGLKARCLLSNMSMEPVYLQSIVARLEDSRSTLECRLTNLENLAAQGVQGDPMSMMKQGPLGPGQFIDIGTFRDIVDEAASRSAGHDPGRWRRDLQALEITVAAVYGPDDLLVGAKRRFLCESHDEELKLVPTSTATYQIRSRHGRRRLERMLIGDL